MSTHEVLVVKVEEIFKHFNADALEIVKVSGYDYSIVSRKGEFQVGDLAIFVEPDYVVNTTLPEFSFLFDGRKDTKRITAKRLRGIWSEGLLIKAKENHKFGDNVMAEFGITRWEPPPTRGFHWGSEGSDLKSGLCEKAPNIPGVENIPVYSVENYKKNYRLIGAGEPVFYTTKIHGASGRYVCCDGEMHCGSRTTWKKKPGQVVEYTNHKTGEVLQKETPDSSWWSVIPQHPWLEEWCRKNPGMIVYGEVFGSIVQGNKFPYGFKGGKLGFRVFDVLRDGKWVPFEELVTNPVFAGLKIVPVLYHGPHDSTLLSELAEKPEDSLENCETDHIREGIVIRTGDGRATLKYVSNNYLTRS